MPLVIYQTSTFVDAGRVPGDLADVAARMDMTADELLAPTPMTDLLRDVLSYTHDQPEEEIDLPTFTSRSAADSVCAPSCAVT